MVRAHFLKRITGAVLNTFVLTALLAASSANAQVNTASTQAILSDLVRGASGATVNAVSSGAVVTSNGTVLVPASGLKIPVPVSVAANVSKARIATAAMGCTNPVGAVVCVATAAALANELLNQPTGPGRYRKCPDGVYSFICKDPNADQPLTYYWQSNSYGGIAGNDPAAVCNSRMISYKVNGSTGGILGALTTLSGQVAYQCLATGGTNPSGGTFADYILRNGAGTCPTNYVSSGGVCKYSGPAGTPIPATDAEVQQSLQEQMDADYAANRRLVEALRKDLATAESQGKVQPDSQKPVIPATPATVTAPPVTTAPTPLSTETKAKPDGSTDTTQKSSVTTISPTVSGSTVGSIEVKYPSQTTVSSSTTNNVTNVTTNETTVINNPTPQEKAFDVPDDYAREATLQKAVDALSVQGSPDMPDQGPVVDTAVTKNKDDLGTLTTAAKADQATDKGLWFSWVFDIPMATCSPFAGTVGGYALSWDLCPAIENIRALLGWIMTIFSGLSVYGNLFRRSE